MPFSLLDLTAKHRWILDLPEFSSLPIVLDFLTDGQNSARIWYHWYHPSFEVQPEGELTPSRQVHHRAGLPRTLLGGPLPDVRREH
jgi:hypothetical protein